MAKKKLPEEVQKLVDDLELDKDVIEQINDAFQAKLKEQEEELKEEAEKEKEKAINEAVAKTKNHLIKRANSYGANLVEKANAYGKYIQKQTAMRVDEYVDHVMQEYIKENEQKFSKLALFERQKNAFDALKAAFESNGFEIESSEDISKSRVTKLEEENNKLFDQLNESRRDAEDAKRTLFYEMKTKELAETQREQVKSLLEKVNTRSLKDFTAALDLIVEEVGRRKVSKDANSKSLNEGQKNLGYRRQSDTSIEAVLAYLK